VGGGGEARKKDTPFKTKRHVREEVFKDARKGREENWRWRQQGGTTSPRKSKTPSLGRGRLLMGGKI